MKWSQKVSLASGIGIATSSLLLGMGGHDGHVGVPSQLHGEKNTTPTRTDVSEIQATPETPVKRRQMQIGSLALSGGIAYLVAARLFKRVRPFRLYATAAALMFAIVPYSLFLWHRKSATSTEQVGQESKTQIRLTNVRAAMTALAAALALVAKATA